MNRLKQENDLAKAEIKRKADEAEYERRQAMLRKRRDSMMPLEDIMWMVNDG